MRIGHVIVGAVLVALGAMGGCWWGQTHAPQSEAEAPPPAVSAPRTEPRPAAVPRHRAEEPVAAPPVAAPAPAPAAPVAHDRAPAPGVATPSAAQTTRLAEATSDANRGALRIIVTDTSGAPRQGAFVCFANSEVRAEQAQTKSGADGKAEFASVAPGQAYVSVGLDGRNRCVPIQVVAGRWTEVPWVFTTGSAVVAGTVRHATKGLLAKLNVLARMRDGTGDSISATTDANGAFRLESVPAGTYDVMLQGEGLGWSDRPRAELVVPEAGTVQRDIVVGLPSLSGTVRDAATNRPIAGVEVQMQEPSFVSTTTDAEGVYRIADVTAPKAKLFVSRDGWESRFVTTGSFSPDQPLAFDVDLRAGAVLVLTVTDERGQPFVGEVLLGISSAATPNSSLGTNVRTGPDGVVRYAKIGTGEYEITVQAGYGAQPGKPKHVTVGAGDNPLAFTVTRPAAPAAGANPIRGTVRDAVTGAALAGVTVHMQQPANRDTVTDAQGAFEIGDPGVGKIQVFLGKDGYGLKVLNGPAIVAGTPLVLDETLDPAATLNLRVKDKQGRPLVGRLVLGIRPAEGTAGTSVGTGVVADETGLAVFRQILPGHYRLRVGTYDGESTSVETEIKLGENTLDVQFR
jgi:hypothetical protein